MQNIELLNGVVLKMDMVIFDFFSYLCNKRSQIFRSITNFLNINGQKIKLLKRIKNNCGRAFYQILFINMSVKEINRGQYVTKIRKEATNSLKASKKVSVFMGVSARGLFSYCSVLLGS